MACPSDAHPCRRHAHRCHIRHGIVHVLAVIGRWGRLLVQDAELGLFGFEILVAVVDDFAVWARFVRATVSGQGVSLGRSEKRREHTERGYRSVRKLCCSADIRMVALGCGSLRV